ncbi:hypothetical protein P153DRAFT_400072 [Dothidotthia symphoricarpi CBS 119687]|uniref:Uncharacterized protein n=1 Tax=Dothidotthia symphoricarpi CBS 119687 TaxID=1392245 RepID=A0A6A6A477_9PLEO|nr:uncharacterized protein P153DRAFT_400072 [Dothidotthia symphoricarpi CBS 119687]KAF2125953.1 hypothetical protein P153DRAFT_400072 [Dothidotthia symphoricarpi CBS 119687]
MMDPRQSDGYWRLTSKLYAAYAHFLKFHRSLSSLSLSLSHNFNMKNIAIIVFSCMAMQSWALPVEGRAVAVGPIIEEAGEGYESKRAVAVGPIIEEAGEGYESKRAVAVGPIIEEAGEGYES